MDKLDKKSDGMFEFIPCSPDFIFEHLREDKLFSELISRARGVKNSVASAFKTHRKGDDPEEKYRLLADIRKKTTGVTLQADGKKILYQLPNGKKIPQKFLALKALSEYKQEYKKRYGQLDRSSSMSIVISQININSLKNSVEDGKQKIKIVCDNFCNSIQHLMKEPDSFNLWIVMNGMYREYLRYLKDYQKSLHVLKDSKEWQSIEFLTNHSQGIVLNQIDAVLNRSNTFRKAGKAIKTSDVKKQKECSYSVIPLEKKVIIASFQSEDPRENIGPGMVSTNKFMANALMSRCAKIPALGPFALMLIEMVEPERSAVYSPEKWETKLRCINARLDIAMNKFRYLKFINEKMEMPKLAKEVFNTVNATLKQFKKNNPTFSDLAQKRRTRDLRLEMYLKYAEMASMSLGKIFNDETNKKILVGAYKNACVVRDHSEHASSMEKRSILMVETLQQTGMRLGIGLD